MIIWNLSPLLEKNKRNKNITRYKRVITLYTKGVKKKKKTGVTSFFAYFIDARNKVKRINYKL